MPEELTASQVATVVTEDQTYTDVPVKVYPSWVRVSTSNSFQYIPRELVNKVQINGR